MIESVDWRLAVQLIFLVGGASLLLSWLARGLGVAVGRCELAIATLLPALFLLPFVDESRTLQSTDFLSLAQIPGLVEVDEAGRYELLNDPTLQFLPWEIEIRRQLSDGQLALWSDRLEGGSSVWSNPQAEVISPIRIASRLLDIEHVFLAGLALKMTVVCLGMIALCRRLAVRTEVARFAGALAALSGAVMPWALFPHSSAAAWTPWLVAGVVGCLRDGQIRGGRSKGSSVGAARVLSTSLAAFAVLASGHPEVAVAAALFCVAALVGAHRRSKLRSGLGRLALALVLGASLAGPTLLPFAASVSSTQRAGEKVGETVDLGRVGWSPASWFDAEHIDFLSSALSPVAFGRAYVDDFGGRTNWAEAGAAYAGIVALAGSVVALIFVRRSRWLLIFWVLAILAASGFAPLAWLLSHLPWLELISYNRLLPVASLSLVAGSALGWNHLMRRRRTSSAGFRGAGRSTRQCVGRMVLDECCPLESRWRSAVGSSEENASRTRRRVWTPGSRSLGLARATAFIELDALPLDVTAGERRRGCRRS